MLAPSPLSSPSPTLFRTPVALPQPCRPIDAAERNVFLGSCFAEHVGRRFLESGLRSVSNPVGAAYCPASMARLLGQGGAASLPRIPDSLPQPPAPLPVAQNPAGQWHTWLTDTAFCRPTPEEARAAAEEALGGLRDALLRCDNLFLTFGTSRAYHLAAGSPSLGADGAVLNCHKHPARDFRERDWTVAEMTEAMEAALTALRRDNPRLQVILTVSPYRYAKYGFHESRLAKARLLLMADALCCRHPQWICYFPAYEILLDELRDYRFYADDMLHPAPAAVAYIWQQLHDHWLTPRCRTYLAQAAPLLRTLSHRPADPESPQWLALQGETRQKLQALRESL